MILFGVFRTHVKAQEIERQKLISTKDAYEKKEIDFNKQSSELRVQVIELRETNVSFVGISSSWIDLNVYFLFAGQIGTSEQ